MLQLRQQRAHLRVLAEGELEARFDPFPHPGQSLLFAALGEAAVSGLQPLVFAHCGPESIHALGLVGTPYRYGGNTPDSGFDCSGLIGYVYQNRAGSAPPRTVAQLDRWGQPIPEQSLRTGDLVVFGKGRAPSHAGIYVGEGRFVHAPSRGGTVRLDRLDSKHWSAQNAAFRRP